MNEFELIKKYFEKQALTRKDVLLGIGDDAALVQVPSGHELVVTTDTLISGVHFPINTAPFDVGYKALAVNLSDLAAMGANPAWVTLALTLPTDDLPWLQAFTDGFFSLAKHYGIALIGGDTTRGPLSITVQALGLVPHDQAILRSGAKPGDFIYVTGTVGDAALALKALQQTVSLQDADRTTILQKFNRPAPRLEVGEMLRGIAHSAIDISDGLAADLNHILVASQVGATVYVDQVPLSSALKHSLPLTDAIQLALTGGDDYELCFTIPADKQAYFNQHAARLSCPVTCIGYIKAEQDLELRYQSGNKYEGSINGYQHF